MGGGGAIETEEGLVMTARQTIMTGAPMPIRVVVGVFCPYSRSLLTLVSSDADTCCTLADRIPRL